MMNANVKQVLEAVANGVWTQPTTSLSGSQCHFCCRAPHVEHEPWCPVVLAKTALAEEEG